MSGQFTPYHLWTPKKHQDLTHANEIIQAYIERRLALNQSVAGIDLLTGGSGGDSHQDKTIWKEIQEWLEANCTSFVNTHDGPLNPAKSAFINYTKATWQHAAGLNVNAGAGQSFKRKVNHPGDSGYGLIQYGDVKGSWNFEDLQGGLGALKYTLRGGGYEYPTSQGAAKGAEWPDGDTDGFATWWEAVAVFGDGVNVYNHEATSGINGWGFHVYDAHTTVDGTITLAFGTTLGRYIDVYIRTIGGGASAPWYDFEGVGLIENEQALYREIDLTYDANVTINEIGGTSRSCPIRIASPFRIIKNDYIRFLIRWNFTNG